MASLVKQHGLYYLQFYDKHRKPKQKRVALQTRTKRTAVAMRKTLEDKYAFGEFDPWQDDPRTLLDRDDTPPTLSQALDTFIAAKKQSGRSEHTIRSYREVVSLLMQHTGRDLLVRDVAPDVITAFLSENHLSKSTRHKRYRHIKAFFRWCLKQGLTARNVMERAQAPEQPEKLPKSMTKDELREICKGLTKLYRKNRRENGCRPGEMIWHIPLYWFAYFTGMRMSELARLRWSHIDFEKRLIYIYRQKNNREQTIPLNRKATEVLEGIKRGEPDDYVFRSPGFRPKQRSARCFVEHASRTFKEARKQAGIGRKLTPHCLRHSFCTRLAEAGKSAVVIKEAARHADIQTSMRYVHMANEHLKSELDDVFG